MEFLPTELLLNIFERLDVSDAGSCRMLNRRYDEIIMKNWRKINKIRGILEFTTYEGKDFYSVTLQSKEPSNVRSDTRLNVPKCFIYHDRMQVFHYKRKKFAVALAGRLGAADPISKPAMNMEVVNYSGETAAFGAVMSLMQLRQPIDTLKIDDIKEEHLNLIISNVPKHSIHTLNYVNPRTSDDVLAVMNKIGFQDIRDLNVIRGNRYKRNAVSNDLMNQLLPHIPFKNVYTRLYYVSFPLILQVIKNWINSNWEITLCVFRTKDPINWRKEIEFFSPEVENRENLRYTALRDQEIYIIQRKTDDHKLRIDFTRRLMNERDVSCIRLYEDVKYIKDFFI